MNGPVGKIGILLGLFILPFAPQIRAQEAEKDLVKTRLLANASTIAPSQQFTVGVEFTIKPEWHIYWKNAGPAGGLPTAIKFKAPDGFVVGDVRWPTPMEFAQPATGAAFGYRETVLLTVVITAPKQLPKDPVTIAAECEWLCCDKICISGNANLTLKLNTGEKSQPANADLFAQWEKRLTLAFKDSALNSAKVEGKLAATEASPFEILLDWKDAPQSVEFFHDAPGGLFIDQVEIKTKGRQTRITFSGRHLKGLDVNDVLASVIAYRDSAGQRHGVEVPVPLNPEPVKTQ